MRNVAERANRGEDVCSQPPKDSCPRRHAGEISHAVMAYAGKLPSICQASSLPIPIGCHGNPYMQQSNCRVLYLSYAGRNRQPGATRGAGSASFGRDDVSSSYLSHVFVQSVQRLDV